VSDDRLKPLRELAPAPRRKGFRVAPAGWPGLADATAPVLPIAAAELWRAWIGFAARQPRTVLRAQDEQAGRSLHLQRSPVLRLPDLVRAEVVPLAAGRSSLVLDSRSRYGCWDLGVNRRRVLRWIRGLQQVVDRGGST
jgi:Protein of unknown function (DUF1499)